MMLLVGRQNHARHPAIQTAETAIDKAGISKEDCARSPDESDPPPIAREAAHETKVALLTTD